jgi:hypothetical protein
LATALPFAKGSCGKYACTVCSKSNTLVEYDLFQKHNNSEARYPRKIKHYKIITAMWERSEGSRERYARD